MSVWPIDRVFTHRSALSRIECTRFRPTEEEGLAGKVAVVISCSVLWLLVSIVRTPNDVSNATSMSLDASWVMGLAATLQDGAIAGRDFHFTYGPVAQLVAAAGSWLNRDDSAFPALPLIMLSFWAYGVVLFAVTLLLLDPIDWKGTLLAYCAAAMLNLFSEPTSFRTLTVLVEAAVLYRSLSSPFRIRSLLLAALAGFVALLAQLTSVDLALYSVVTIAGPCAVLVLLSMLPRTRSALFLHPAHAYLAAAGVALGTFGLGNLIVSLIFRLSSGSYGGLFDYQRFALEIIRGYSLTMGSPWELGRLQTLGLIVVLTYTACFAAFLLRAQSACGVHLLLVLSICSVALMKGATVRSDIGHITLSAGPFVFLFLVIGNDALKNSRAGLCWICFGIVLVLIWPWAGVYALKDIHSMLAGQTAILDKLDRLRGMRTTPETLPEGLAQAVSHEKASMLNVPYEISIGIALKRLFIPPFLQAYAAHTARLQDYYVESLRKHQVPFTVTYGLDSLASPLIDSVQHVTRLPIIFEYLYRNFELRGGVYGAGFLLLRHRPSAVAMNFSPVSFASEQKTANLLLMHSNQFVSCSLVRLEMIVGYSWKSMLGRPTGATVTFLEGNRSVQSTRLVALEDGREFSTIISLMAPADLSKLFSNSLVPQTRWDTIRIEYSASDLLDVLPSETKVIGVGCFSGR